MPRVSLSVSDEVLDLLKSIPKAMRGQFITASIEYFMNSADGQKIIAFLTTKLDIDPPVAQQSTIRSETVIELDNIGIDTSDWSV